MLPLSNVTRTTAAGASIASPGKNSSPTLVASRVQSVRGAQRNASTRSSSLTQEMNPLGTTHVPSVHMPSSCKSGNC